MSQVSYGTITITDTNDIESIVIEYNKNQSNQNPPSEGDSNWSTNRPTWQQGYYIWQRARIHKSGTATTADIIGTPVCVTGSTGEQGQPGTAGRSLTGVETKYCIYGTGTPSDSYSGWQDTIPEYNSSTPNYWVKVTNTYSSAPTTEVVKYKDTGITNAMAKAADAQSKAATAETNAASALSLSQATQQHFWFNAEDIGSGVNLIKSGAYITDTSIDSFKQNKTGGYLLARSDGLIFGKDTRTDAILNSDGLITKSGGIIAGESGSNGYIYLSTHDYPLKDISDPDNPINGLTINNHTPTAEGTDGKMANDPAWREVIGTKFGVDSEGNLYAAGAHIDGDIIAQSLTIGSGANAYDGMAAINISGYSIEIVIENIEEDSDHVYLYPHLYHNGIEERVSDYTRFLWYENNNEIAIIGDRTNYGRILASRSNSYRVTYEFDDGEVGSGTPIETIKVEPTEYITNIDDIGIKVHPKQWSTDSNYLQIDGNGVYIKDSNDMGLAEFTAANAQIGKSESTHFMINADSLQAFNELGNKYFEVTANGLTWGSNAAATTTQVDNAALTASNYITDLTDGGVRIHPINNENNSVVIDSNGMEIFKGGTDDDHSVAKYGDILRIGKNENAHIDMDYHSMQLKDSSNRTYFYVSDLRDSDGIAIVQNQWTADSNQTSFSTQMPIFEVISVTVNGTEVTDYTVSNGFDINFSSGKSAGDVVIATYKTKSFLAKAYTLGLRKEDGVVGALSHAEGWRTVASGTSSHAEGFNTTASGTEAHAEGSGTTASGGYSHAEGIDTVASGNFSHAGGMGTIAKGGAQTAIGSYNVADNNSLFIIGKGNILQRSNAFAVSTTGQVFVNGTSVHTSDRRLKEHIAYLDEDADEFIRQLKPAHYIKDDEHHVGFYAQDVDEADKWNCMTGEMNGYMTLGYMELIAPLVTYCQHLEKRINELENKMKEGSNGEKSS